MNASSQSPLISINRLISRKKLPTAQELTGVFLSQGLKQSGPLFVKLGQILSSRPDLVGEKIADELEILLEEQQALSFKNFKKTLKKSSPELYRKTEWIDQHLSLIHI